MKPLKFIGTLSILIVLNIQNAISQPTPWVYGGNGITNPSTEFIGTTSNQPFLIYTDNDERMRVDEDGNVGIGTTGPPRSLKSSRDSF